ncbi:MAG: hypothetical protein Q4D71_08645 [Oscillospiraceae bacterium]|nr:hypothetical protein [Oscillospiraceae bacterium]
MLIIEAYRFRGYDKDAPQHSYETPARWDHHEYQEDPPVNEKVQPVLYDPEGKPVPENGKSAWIKQFRSEHCHL